VSEIDLVNETSSLIVYSFAIDFTDLILADGSNWKDATSVIDNIKTAISNHIEIHAYYTTDKTTIKPLIKSCFLRYDCADCDSKMPLRNLKALETTLDSCATQHRNAKAITVNLFLNFLHTGTLTPAKPSTSATSKSLTTMPSRMHLLSPRPPYGLCPGVLALILQVDRNVRLYFEALAPA